MAVCFTADPSLRRWYREFNRKWWADELPHDADVFYAPLGDTIADLWYDAAQTPVIRIDPIFSICSRMVRLALLHEMAHIRLRSPSHGAVFQAEMLRLAAAGAMKGLW